MIFDGRVYIDNTVAQSTARCSMQVVLRHVLHWNTIDDSAYLRAGTAMHETQAAWNRGESADVALAVFDVSYKEFSDDFVTPSEDTRLKRLEHENLRLILEEWFASRAGRLPWIVPDPRLVEVGFAYPLDASGRAIAYGRMDLVARDARDGSWIIVDHKSTGRIDQIWVEMWQLDSQVSQYYWGGLQHVPNLRGFFVNGIEFSRLPESDRKCAKHGLPYSQCKRAHMNAQIVGPLTRTPAQLERWHFEVTRLAEKYRFYAETYDPAKVGTTPDLSNVEMEGVFTNSCRFCSFRNFCRLGAQSQMLPKLFVQDEWRPYDPRDYEQKTLEGIIE